MNMILLPTCINMLVMIKYIQYIGLEMYMYFIVTVWLKNVPKIYL